LPRVHTPQGRKTGHLHPSEALVCPGTVKVGFGEGHVHYVPLRSLIPEGTENLLAVGRCIDADPLALSSVRVMGPCIAMGAAAAHVTDLCLERSVPPHEVDLEALAERLRPNLKDPAS